VVIAVIIVLSSSGGEGDSGRATAPSRVKKVAQRTKKKATPGKVTNATPRADWVPHPGPVPILEYHVLGHPPEGAPYPELYVGRTDFEKQMDWLEEQGYQAVTLEQVEEAWYHGGKLPPKPIVLSFDDGYRPQFTFALPTLRKHGWAGVLNLKAEGSDLYESNVKAMIAAGWELAAHTIHHLDLTELGPEELKEEVAGSRKLLQKEYGVPVDNFCYPAGQFDETVVKAVEEAGYTGATTEISGFAERGKPFELARLEILRESHVKGLAEDLKNGKGATAELGP
jgi:peptidoglycan/xylan/chitin deacetylase (PgdA/CDA1 family)